MWIKIDNRGVGLDKETICSLPEFRRLVEAFGWEMVWFIIYQHWYKSPYIHLPEDKRKERAIAEAFGDNQHALKEVDWQSPLIEEAVKKYYLCQDEVYDVKYRLYFTYAKKLQEADEYLSALKITDKNSGKIKKICEGIRELESLMDKQEAVILGKTGREQEEKKPKRYLSWVEMKMKETLENRKQQPTVPRSQST